MSKKRFTSTFDMELLKKAKLQMKILGLNGINAVIEEALKVYFDSFDSISNIDQEVYEMPQNGGWTKRLIIMSDKVLFESIRCKKVLRYKANFHNYSTLTSRGWKQIY
jgi:hypothetical protein